MSNSENKEACNASCMYFKRQVLRKEERIYDRCNTFSY